MQTLSIGKKKRIYAIAFSPCGGKLAAACGDLRLRIWDLTTGQILQTATIEKSTIVNIGFNLTFLNEHQLLLGGATLSIWNSQKDEWSTISPDFVWGRQMRISPDGKYYAEVAKAESMEVMSGLRVLHVDDWKPLTWPPEESGTTGGIAFSPDGSQLATGHISLAGYKNRSIGRFGSFQVNDYEYTVNLMKVPSGELVGSIEGWKQGVTNLAFSPNGKVIAGTAGIWLRAWDLEADTQLALHKRGPKHFQGLSFNSDGQFLATVSNDEMVRIWDTNSWGEYRTYSWGIGSLLNIAFAPDGLRTAAGSDKGQIMIWDVD